MSQQVETLIVPRTALHLAVMNEHLNLVQANMTLFQWAKVMNHSDIAQYLQKHSVMPYIYTAIAMMKRLRLFKLV